MQDQPNGLAEALLLGEEFLDGDSCALILGDNLFYGPGLGTHLQQNTSVEGALIFAYQVSDPSHYGVVEFDEAGTVLSIEEKPLKPKSTYAVPGSISTTRKGPALARELKPSDRGELEITALNNAYSNAANFASRSLARHDVARYGHPRVALRSGWLDPHAAAPHRSSYWRRRTDRRRPRLIQPT